MSLEIGYFSKLNIAERRMYSFTVWTLLSSVGILLLIQLFFPENLFSGAENFDDYVKLIGVGGSNSAFLALALYYLALPIVWWELICLSGVSILLEFLGLIGGTDISLWSIFTMAGWRTGLVFTVGIILRLIREPSQRVRAVGLLSIIACLGVTSLFTFRIMQLLTYLYPVVFDSWGFLADSTWGGQPSIAIAKFQGGLPKLEYAVLFFYAKLAFFQSLATVLVIRFSQKCYNDVFAASVLLGVFSMALYYHILPMIGIDDYLGGVKVYPNSQLPDISPNPSLFRAPGIYPRTCAPSMHAAWILSAYLAVCRVNLKIRLVGLVVVLMTILGTMNRLVGHYFLDIVAALPLVVAVQGLTAWPTEENWIWRKRNMILGFLGCALYLGSIRFLPGILFQTPILFAVFQVLLVLTCLWSEHRLAKVSLPEERS